MARGKLKKNNLDREWAKKVKERDGNVCVICGKQGNSGIVHAHHLIPIEIREHRWNVDNGITLCPSHHRFSREISAHQNPIAFYMWMEINRKEQLKDVKTKIRWLAKTVPLH